MRRARGGRGRGLATRAIGIIFTLILAAPGGGYSTASTQEVVGPDQFSDLMRGLHAPIRSVSFLYEGESQRLGPARAPSRDGRRPLGASFQGIYAYKANGSAFLDLYADDRIEGGVSPMRRKTVALAADGRFEVNSSVPDRDGPAGRPVAQEGGLQDFVQQHSPISFCTIGLLRPFLDDPRRRNYEFLGWEEVDGHECLKIRFKRGSDPTPERPHLKPSFQVYWIDLARGGHPIRLELYDGEDLSGRTSEFQLERFGDGEAAQWMPVGAKVESFLWNGVDHKRPVIVTTYAVVRGTMGINREIPDSLFHARREDGVPPISRALGLATLERDMPLVAEAARRASTAPEPALGPAGVSERLDRMLAEADRQAEMLEASSAARRPWNATRLAATAFVALGAAAIVAGLVLTMRRG